MKQQLTPDVPGKIEFNPVKIGSIVPQIERQKSRDADAAARYIQSQNQSMETAKANAKQGIEAAKMYGEDWQKLAKFSKTLTDYLVEEKHKQNQAEMEEGIAAAYEQGISPWESDQLEAVESEIKANDFVTQAAGAEAFEQTNSYEVASRVKNLSGWKAYGYSIGRAQMAGASYGSWMADAMENDDSTVLSYNGNEFTPATAKTQAEVSMAMAVLRRKFIKQMGIGGANAAVLAKYAFPQMAAADSKLLFDRRNSFDKEVAFEETQEAYRIFHADKDLNGLFSRLKSVRGQDGKLIGNSGAHAKIKEFLVDSIRNGTLSREEVKALGEQEVAWAPGKKFKDHYRNLISGALQQATQVQRAEDNFARQEKKRIAQEKVAEIAAAIAGNEGMYSEEDINSIIQEIRSDPDLAGVNISILERVRDDYSIDAGMKEAQQTRMAALAQAGLLRPHHLQGVHSDVWQQWQGVATNQAKAAGTTGNFKDQMDAIAGEVKAKRKELNGDGSVTISTQAVISELQAKFRQRVAKKINDGIPPEQAANEAMAEVQLIYREESATDNPDGKYFKGPGRDNMLRRLQSSAQESSKASKTVAFDKKLALVGLDKAIASGEFASLEELTANEQLWGTPEWKLPGIVQHIVDNQPGHDPLETLNKFRAAVGLEPMVSPAAQAAQGMTTQGQKLLRDFKSSLRTTRAYSSEVQSWNAASHPYGAFIETAAATNGIEPALIAAMIEIESTNNPNAVSPTGAVGLMQIQTAAHPNYRGGTDPQANINYGAQYFAGLIQRFGGNVDHAVAAYNMGPNGFERHLRGEIPMPEETKNHIKKFNIALAKYQPNLNNTATMRGQFEVVQVVSTDPRYEGDSDPTTLFDPAGHGGDAMHQHYEFRTKEQAALAKALYESKGFRVTSYIRPHDHGSAHQHGYAIDVAPPLNLSRTDEAEMAWIDKANAVIGLN